MKLFTWINTIGDRDTPHVAFVAIAEDLEQAVQMTLDKASETITPSTVLGKPYTYLQWLEYDFWGDTKDNLRVWLRENAKEYPIDTPIAIVDDLTIHHCAYPDG